MLHRIYCSTLSITWNSHLKCDKVIEYLTNDAIQGTATTTIQHDIQV